MKDAGNQLSDFPPEQFTISLFCDACDHRADLDREKYSGPQISDHSLSKLSAWSMGVE